MCLFVDRLTHRRRPEAEAPGLLDDRLVDGWMRLVHMNNALVEVNFRIRSGVPDQVYHPFLPFLFGHVQSGRQVRNVYLLVNPAVDFGNQKPGRFDEALGVLLQEKVVICNFLSLGKLILRSFEVEIGVQLLDEVYEGVRLKPMRFLTDHSRDVSERCSGRNFRESVVALHAIDAH